MNKIDKAIEEAGEKDRYLEDGIYDIEDIEFIEVLEPPYKEVEKIENFIRKYPDFYIASAYETQSTILLSREPMKFKGEQIGSEFNYGSTNILKNCPKNILILAEND